MRRIHTLRPAMTVRTDGTVGLRLAETTRTAGLLIVPDCDACRGAGVEHGHRHRRWRLQTQWGYLLGDLRRFERFAVGDHVRIDDGSEWVLTAAAVAKPWVWVQGSTEFADQMVSPMWIRQRHGRLLTATVRVDGSELLHYAAEQCSSAPTDPTPPAGRTGRPPQPSCVTSSARDGAPTSQSPVS